MCLAVALIISATSCGKKQEKKETEDVSSINVTTASAALDNVGRIVSYNGDITAGDYVSVTTKVSAKVSDIYIKEGDYVTSGTVLAKLDSTDLKLAYNQALANYNNAMAGYDMTANASTKQAETAAEQRLAAAELEYNDAVNSYNRQKELFDNDSATITAQNALNDAKQNLERTKQLYEMGAVSKVQYDSAVTAVENAQAALESVSSNAQAAMDAAKTRMDNAANNLAAARENRDLQVGVLSEKSIASAKAATDTAKATLDIASNNLKNATITAPISGYVSAKNIEKGQMASPGIEIFAIKNTGYVDAEINVTEADIPYVAVGTPANVTIKSAGLSEIEGTVSAVNPTKNAQTGLYSVKIAIPNESGSIKAGMFADISLTLQMNENVISIPSEAIMQDGEEFYVFVASADGKTSEKRVITKGIENAETTEILTGISEGENIIIKGKEYLSDKNNKIKITN